MSEAPTGADAREGRRGIGGMLVDVSLLKRNRSVRLLFIGQGVSFFGTMFTAVLLPFQVYKITGSSLAVGLLGIAEVVPVLITAMIGGALADRVDRRKMIAVTEMLLALVSTGLLVNAFSSDPRLWVLYTAAALMSGIEGFQRPSLDALAPQLVESGDMAAWAALNSIRMGLGFVVAPAIAGVVIAAGGVEVGYIVDVATCLVALVALSMFRAQPVDPEDEKLDLHELVDGLKYAASRRDLMGTYLIDFTAMVFGTPTALFPQLADKLGGPTTLGLLYAAPAVGTLVTSTFSNWSNRVYRRGRVIVIVAAGWGAVMACLGLATEAWIAIAVLVVAGALDGVSMVFRSTLWNESIPERYRGRLASVELVSVSTGPAIGNFEAGGVAAAAGLRTSIVSGGVLAVVGAVVVGIFAPALWKYDSRDHTEGAGDDAPLEAHVAGTAVEGSDSLQVARTPE